MFRRSFLAALASGLGGALLGHRIGRSDMPATDPRVNLGEVYTLSGDGTRIKVWDNGGQVFNAKAYGAKGDGVTDDTAAIQAAIDAAKLVGGGVLFSPGTYLVTSLNVPPAITLHGNGATLRRPDLSATKFSRMLTTENHPWDSAVDSPPLVIRNLILDGNRQNQGAYTGYELEHAHCLFLWGGNATQPGRLRVVLDNVTCIDSPADGISVSSNVHLQYNKLYFRDCFRGGLVSTGGHSVVQGTTLEGKGEVHGSGFQVETDGTGFGGSYTTEINVEGMLLDGNFDVATRGADSIFRGRGIHMRKPRFYLNGLGAATFELSDSTFAIGAQSGTVDNFLRPGKVTCTNCTFLVSKARDAAATTFSAIHILWTIGSTRYTGQRVRLVDCRLQVAPDIDPATTTLYGVYQEADLTETNLGDQDNWLIIEGGEIAKEYDYGLYMKMGGLWNIKDLRNKAATSWWWSFGTSRYADITIDNMDVRGNTTYMHAESRDAKNIIRHRNTMVEEAHAGLTRAIGPLYTNTFLGSRMILVDSDPTARLAGLRGDVAVLKAPAASAPYRWVCTQADLATAAIWKAEAALSA
jgi:hypothetical protein